MATVSEALQAALAHHRAGQLGQAEQIYRQILEAHPRHAGAMHLLGLIALEIGRPALAVEWIARAIRLDGFQGAFHAGLGEAYRALGKLADAQACYEQVLRILPDAADAHNTLGAIRQARGQLADAKACYERALELNPADPAAQCNLASVLQSEGNHAAAVQFLDQALTAWPDHAEGRFLRGTMWLAEGRFLEGWREFEHRARCKCTPPRSLAQPLWNGTPLGDKTLLLYSEYGMGDVLQFIRYVPLVQARSPKTRVLLEVHRALIPLLNGSGFSNVVERGEVDGNFDVQLPLMSLPAVFETTLENIPNRIPYLSADGMRAAEWQRRLSGIGGFKVGIHWQGSVSYASDRQRSMALSCFAPLAEVPGVQLISLQKGAGSEQVAEGSARFPVLTFPDLDESGGAFVDTAALMASLDLVITCDSAPGHLAGALGVPVWIALTVAPDWRWMLERTDSPWYPTVRLFRQESVENWPEVFKRMAAELAVKVIEKNSMLAAC